MGAANSCSKAAWELHIAFLIPPGEFTQISRGTALRIALNFYLTEIREIC
jgi:hypothetical protein